MNKILPFAAILFFAVGILSSSCERGNSVGAVGFDDEDGFQTFDTFNCPTEGFFFCAKFDGGYKLWQDGQRSKWDTATKINTTGDPDLEYDLWDDYTRNIYRNIPEENGDDSCITGAPNVWYEQVTRFLRPGIPEERMEIFFYDCVDTLETIPASNPFNGEIVTNLKWETYGIAQPFSEYAFGRRGMKVVYTDDQRDKWSTKPGSGQEYDTYFRLYDFYPRDVQTDTVDTLAMYIVEGEFAGRLYNGSDEIPVTEGRFRARLIPHVSFFVTP